MKEIIKESAVLLAKAACIVAGVLGVIAMMWACAAAGIPM